MTLQLTEHFTLEELCHSQAADRLGLSNAPTAIVVQRLQELAHGLEKIRALVGYPISISSGYRSPMVNRAVGGASNSQHMTGQAADITAPGFGSPSQLMEAIVCAKIPYDQVILEFANPNDDSKGWVHVSFSSQDRRQALVIDHSGTRVYA